MQESKKVRAQFNESQPECHIIEKQTTCLMKNIPNELIIYISFFIDNQ